jgi:uncharacterized OsmC-like protein
MLGAAVSPEAVMTMESISKAMQRVRAVLARRPEAGVHADDPAIAHWDQGMRVVTRHANGYEVATDMPVELGGAGAAVTPGWLLRAGLASCLATRIVMEAAAAGISIRRLEVSAGSTTDVRGLLGVAAEGGAPVTPAPHDLRLQVRMSAPDVSPERIQGLVEESFRCSPVSAALERVTPVAFVIDLDRD